MTQGSFLTDPPDDTIALLGSGGLAREFAAWTMDALAREGVSKRLVMVNDLDPEPDPVEVCGRYIEVVSTWTRPYRFIVGVGKPKNKRVMIEKALLAGWQPHPGIVHPTAICLSPPPLGGMVSPGCIVTVDVKLGDFVTLNLNTTVGHDTYMGAMSTTNPGVQVSGNCRIGHCVELGTGAIVRDGMRIVGDCTIGAQAGVVKHIDAPGTYIGTPARPL